LGWLLMMMKKKMMRKTGCLSPSSACVVWLASSRVFFLTIFSCVQALVAGGVETVADLAGLDYQDLGKYDLPREVRDKLGRVVSG
jgi:hypothetical protein